MSKNTPKFILGGQTKVSLLYNDKGESLQLMTHVFHKHGSYGLFLNKLQDLLFLKNIKLEWEKDITRPKVYFYCYCCNMNKDKIKDFIECLELTCRSYEKTKGDRKSIGPVYMIQTDEGRKELSREDFLERIE